jgi:two-component system, cell cycle sensor histidine kinase and response regulator CckA
MEPISERIASEKHGQRYGTILVVEDEKHMSHLLEKVLSRHGWQVLVASDGEQAIEAYRSQKLAIDVVLLDVGLPKIPGLQVLSKIKAENPGVRVVIASGYLEPKTKTEMAGAGVKHFVNKPYMLDEVVQTIQSLIEK